MLSPKSWLKVLPVVLLSCVQVVGISEEARSQIIVQQSSHQSQEIDQLIKKFRTRKNRKETLESLAKIGEPAIPKLISLLKDQNKEVRSLTASALGRMGKSAKSTIPYLIPLLQDEDFAVQSSAAEVLEKLGDRSPK
ncbi:MAG: HEAT repeat domain-containing protein [Synechococcales bacterium]|nr:HEAT repeat domain-containing protein [Synechococcales bacterium]